MKHPKPYYSKLMMVFSLSTIVLFVDAQKLPKIQATSLRAPADIKIDGRLPDWHDQLQANNPTCRLAYTISNDDGNLYLTVRMAGNSANVKALQGGITFTIRPPAESGVKSKDISITFPVALNKHDAGRDGIMANAAGYFNRGLDRVTPENKKTADSLVSVTNKQLMNVLTEIQVDGLNGITEPVLSIYNNEGIRAASQFDQKMMYTYELAIPLKYFALSVISGNKFRYNIKLGSAAITASTNPNAPPPPVAARDEGTPVDFNYEYMNNPTDFWGDYTLAK